MARPAKYPVETCDPPETFYWGPEIDKQTAKSLGLKRYFTGVPCKHGHIAERHVSTSYCIQCGLERHRTPEYRADMRPVYVERYHGDPEFRERRKAFSRDYWRFAQGG